MSVAASFYVVATLVLCMLTLGALTNSKYCFNSFDTRKS